MQHCSQGVSEVLFCRLYILILVISLKVEKRKREMYLSIKHTLRLKTALILLSVLGILGLSISLWLKYTTRTASPTFTYPPTNSKMVTDNSMDLLRGNPQGAKIAQTSPTIDFGLVDINPRRYGTE